MTEIQIYEIKQAMCDNYCSMPIEAQDQEELDELCKCCPLKALEADE